MNDLNFSALAGLVGNFVFLKCASDMANKFDMSISLRVHGSALRIRRNSMLSGAMHFTVLRTTYASALSIGGDESWMHFASNPFGLIFSFLKFNSLYEMWARPEIAALV